MTDTPTKRRRATPLDVSLKRSAMAVVRALHPEIARVQTRAAFLLSLSQHRRRGDTAVLEAEVAALETTVEGFTSSLADQLGELPEDVRNHGRVVDTVKALKSVHTILGRAKEGFAQSELAQPAYYRRSERAALRDHGEAAHG